MVRYTEKQMHAVFQETAQWKPRNYLTLILGISRSYFAEVLNGKRPISARLADEMGFTRMPPERCFYEGVNQISEQDVRARLLERALRSNYRVVANECGCSVAHLYKAIHGTKPVPAKLAAVLGVTVSESEPYFVEASSVVSSN